MEATQDKPEAMAMPEPTKEHRWLQKLVGSWAVEGEATMGPDKPPSKYCGTETARLIGDVWVACEAQGEAPGGIVATNVMTLGFDPQKGRFTGTFISSMMTHHWVYDGEMDQAEKALTLFAEGPNFEGTGMAKYKDVIEVVSDDHRTLSSHVQNEDGTWRHFMTAHYRRTS